MAFGSDRSRFSEVAGKRAEEDKNFGPLVKTVMNRCIHCTRCVRFANEVAGVDDLGTSGRGNDMQIGTYIGKMINSEMSGNIIDLCPVGALTSKPYAFMARPWELKKTESIDVHDAIGSNIRVDSRGMQVMRILPKINEEINEEWIADKSRFSCDGLRRQRLTTPMIKQDDSFIPVSWEKALKTIAEKIKTITSKSPEKLQVVSGALTDVETLVVAKDLFRKVNCSKFSFDIPISETFLNVDVRSNYIFNTTIQGVEAADTILLIGTNPKHEAPILNSRIRKNFLYNPKCTIGVVGPQIKLNYEYEYLGNNISVLKTLNEQPFFEKLKNSKRPVIIVGSGVLEDPICSQTVGILKELIDKAGNIVTKEWNGYNVLHRVIEIVGANSRTQDTLERWKLDSARNQKFRRTQSFCIY
jgi:NADH dehydrogenase (ubiquinone) Fe-S protein 1